MMFLVPKTKFGEIKWDDTFEISVSLEEWAEGRNRQLRDMGIKNYWYSRVSNCQVNYHGHKDDETASYHVCEKNPFRLV
jgi:hypothetical protein